MVNEAKALKAIIEKGMPKIIEGLLANEEYTTEEKMRIMRDAGNALTMLKVLLAKVEKT